MDHKIGVYIDTGYGIGEALDIEALSSVATSEFKAAVCRADSYWSDPEKLAIIRNDIATETDRCYYCRAVLKGFSKGIYL